LREQLRITPPRQPLLHQRGFLPDPPEIQHQSSFGDTNERSLQLGLRTTLNTTDPSSRSISVTVTFPYLGAMVAKPNVAHAARRVRTTYTPPSTRGTALSVTY